MRLAWQWAAVRSAHPAGDLSLALALQLIALPVPIDRRLEAFGVPHGPDLLADDKVLGVQLQRALPRSHGCILLALFQQLRSMLHPGFDQRALGRREVIGRQFGIRRRLHRFPVDQFANRLTVFGAVDAEASVFRVPDDAVLVHEDAVGHNLEVEDAPKMILPVNEDGIGGSGTFDPRSRRLRSLRFQGDRDQLKVLCLMLRIEVLPPGQLLATTSP